MLSGAPLKLAHRNRAACSPLQVEAGTRAAAGETEVTLKQACFQGYPESAVYVQIPIGSRNSAIHNAYHTSLRPSSLFEPRHPSLKVVFDAMRWSTPKAIHSYKCISTNNGSFTVKEDGPMLIHYPRTSARGSGCYPNPVQKLINGSSQ